MSGRVVLVAVDASENAKNALEYYLDNVHRPTDAIVIANCPEPPNLSSFSLKGGLHLPVEEWKGKLEEAAAKLQKLEDDYRAILLARDIKSMKFSGTPANKAGEGILTAATENSASLIVIGSRGLGPIQRAFLGSVSEHVIRHSSVPVLVCPCAERK